MKKIILRSLAVIVIVVLIAVGYFFITFRNFMAVSEGTLIPKSDIEKTAVLVIDIQEGTSGTMAQNGGYGDRIVPFLENVNRVIQAADSAEILIGYVYHHNTHWLINFGTNNVMAKGTPGTALDKRLLVVNDNRFSKTHSDGFHNPELEAFLRKNGVNHIIAIGLDVSYCVNKTTHAALNRGYQVTVIKDAVIGQSEEIEEQMLQEYAARGIKLMTTNEFPKFSEKQSI